MERERLERDREENFKKWQEIKARQLADKKRDEEKLEAMKEIELQNKQEENFKAFVKWYKQSAPTIRELKDTSTYVTIGFSGQKIQAIYDRSTHRKPTFVNPNEWVDLSKGDGADDSKEEASDDDEHVFKLWAESCRADAGVRSRVSHPVQNSQSFPATRKFSFRQTSVNALNKPKPQSAKTAQDVAAAAAANRKNKDYNPSNPGGKQASWRRMQEEMAKGVQTQVTKPKKKTKVQKKPAGSLEPVPVKRRVRNELHVEQVAAH